VLEEGARLAGAHPADVDPGNPDSGGQAGRRARERKPERDPGKREQRREDRGALDELSPLGTGLPPRPDQP